MKTEHHKIGRSLIRGALIDLRLIYLKVDQENMYVLGVGGKGGEMRAREARGGARQARGSEGKGEGGGERRREREKGSKAHFVPIQIWNQIQIIREYLFGPQKVFYRIICL